jgi:YVTN family beta-propeller protein
MKKLITHHSSLTLLIGIALIVGGVLSLMSPALAQIEPTELPLYALPDSRVQSYSSSTMALANDNQLVVVVNTFNNSVSFTQPRLRTLLTEIPVGSDPRSIVLTDDNRRAVVTNRGDGTLSVIDMGTRTVTSTISVGVLPYGIVMADNQTAYVSLQGEGAVVLVNIDTGRIVERIVVPSLPSGLALWGDFLYVTHFWSGQISLIYLPQHSVVRTINTGMDTGLSQSIAIDIVRGMAYVPQTRSNAQNPALTFDTTVFPVVNVLDLASMSVERSTRIALDTADRPVNIPFAALVDRFQQRLYVVNAGSDDVSVIDLTTGIATAHIEVGVNPRGAVLNNESTFLYVDNALDGSISVINTSTMQVENVVPISTATISADLVLGAQLFYGAHDPRVSANTWISCANCHFDGLSDGRNWVGFGDGGRNAPLLYDLLGTPPYNWSATWDELADVEVKIRDIQAGFGLIEGTPSPALGDPHAGQSLDLDSLTQYLLTLEGPTSQTLVDPELVARGAEVFEEQGCVECHVGDVGTNLQVYDVGTDGTFDTPSLRWLWLSAPYFHDGRAATLRDVFTLPGTHQLVYSAPVEDVEALLAYLFSLPQGG